MDRTPKTSDSTPKAPAGIAWNAGSIESRESHLRAVLFLVMLRSKIGYPSTDAERLFLLTQQAFDLRDRILDEPMFRVILAGAAIAGQIDIAGDVVHGHLSSVRIAITKNSHMELGTR